MGIQPFLTDTLRNLDYSLGTLKVKRLGEGTVFLVPFFFGLMKWSEPDGFIRSHNDPTLQTWFQDVPLTGRRTQWICRSDVRSSEILFSFSTSETFGPYWKLRTPHTQCFISNSCSVVLSRTTRRTSGSGSVALVLQAEGSVGFHGSGCRLISAEAQWCWIWIICIYRFICWCPEIRYQIKPK